MTRPHYTVIYEHGDRPNQWLAHVKELPQCHTFGRGIAQTRARIREALVLWEGEKAESAVLDEVLPLPKETRKTLQHLAELRSKLEQFQKEAQKGQAAVVASLKSVWSMRDIAEILDLSHQRVNQVVRRRRRPLRRRVATSK